MQFDILTLFPAMFGSPLDETILKRAREARLIDVRVHDIRAFTSDKHHVVDDTPYGGGAGMVMKPEPLVAAFESIVRVDSSVSVLLTPQGERFTQGIARELACLDQLILICGRYEGIDERARGIIAEREISIGDYVLSGGEIAAMAVIDAVTRLIPGVLGNETSTHEESFEEGLLEYPQYTRPDVFRGQAVPEVLKSGNHARIARWRREQAIARTLLRRPDLVESADLDKDDRAFLEELRMVDKRGQNR